MLLSLVQDGTERRLAETPPTGRSKTLVVHAEVRGEVGRSAGHSAAGYHYRPGQAHPTRRRRYCRPATAFVAAARARRHAIATASRRPPGEMGR
jgi:hypothetical protein